VVVVAEGGDVRQALRRAGVRVDKALELTAGITLPGVLASLPAGGRVCVAGNLRGTPIPLESGRLIVRELEIVGSVGSRKRDLAASLALLAEGAVAPVIGATLPLRRAAEAHAAMEASAVTGRIVLKPW
jgi:NADPH2:quinone reductase